MIPYDEIQAGDILVFKRKGWVSGVLARLLKRFEPWWDGWGWHMAIAWQKSELGYWILEAAGEGVRVNLIRDKVLKTEVRAYRWLDELPSDKAFEEFMAENLDCGYDVAVYLWTMLQYLVLHFRNRRIPRILDNSYTCWELAFFFARKLGKPIQSIHKYPIITDFLKAVRAA